MVSCKPVNDDATAVCHCYKELLKISPEKEALKMEAVADSCGKLHASVLQKFEKGSDEHKAFIEAYTFCQNE